MQKIPSKYFDLILTDPPYGINVDVKMHKSAGSKSKNSKAYKTDYGYSNWDSSIPKKEVFDEMIRVSKNAIIFGGNYFVEYLTNSSCWLIWDKDNGNNNFADAELAWTNFKTAVRKYKFTWNGMLQNNMKFKEPRFHPTQKPIKLFQDILRNYAKPGYKIFDPFMGSGTTAIAATSLGLEWYGCELQEKYIKIANNRLLSIQNDIFGLNLN